jgi:hypothetical protein
VPRSSRSLSRLTARVRGRRRAALQPVRAQAPVCWSRVRGVERARSAPRAARQPLPSRPSWPSWLYLPWRRQPALRGVIHPRRRVDECDPPVRLQSTPTDSRRRYLVFGRVRATLCSLTRALLRARALEFSLAPKRSFTSCPRTFGGHSFLFFHNYGLLLVARPCKTATSDSPTLARNARATCETCTSVAHTWSRHHHTPRPSPRPKYHKPWAVRPARTISASSRLLRHTTHVRVGAMPRPPKSSPPQLLPRRHPRRR